MRKTGFASFFTFSSTDSQGHIQGGEGSEGGGNVLHTTPMDL